MNSTKIDPKYITKSNPRIGLIALASDFMIERDFINVIKDREIDFFVNRIECYNPLTKENLYSIVLKLMRLLMVKLDLQLKAQHLLAMDHQYLKKYRW